MLGPLRRLQWMHARARFSSAVSPPCCSATMWSGWWGSKTSALCTRQYSQWPAARSQTSWRKAAGIYVPLIGRWPDAGVRELLSASSDSPTLRIDRVRHGPLVSIHPRRCDFAQAQFDDVNYSISHRLQSHCQIVWHSDCQFNHLESLLSLTDHSGILAQAEINAKLDRCAN